MATSMIQAMPNKGNASPPIVLQSGAKKIGKFVKKVFRRKPRKEVDGIFKDEEKGLLSNYNNRLTTLPNRIANFTNLDKLELKVEKDDRPIVAIGVPVNVEVGIPVNFDVVVSENNSTNQKKDKVQERIHTKKPASKTNQNEALARLDKLMPTAPNTLLSNTMRRAASSSNKTNNTRKKKNGPMLG